MKGGKGKRGKQKKKREKKKEKKSRDLSGQALCVFPSISGEKGGRLPEEKKKKKKTRAWVKVFLGEKESRQWQGFWGEGSEEEKKRCT